MKINFVIPCLLGLEHARVELPTPYGDVTVKLEKGKEPVVTAPDEVKVIFRS